MTPTIDLSAPRSVHVVAIGGAAMSAIARYLRQLGHTVTGSDARASNTLAALAAEGIGVHVGHDAAHLPVRCDLVAISTAVRADNPEVVAARERGVPVLGRGEAMALIVATKPNAAVVSGTHGKTTTTSMLAVLLDAAGKHPSFFLGGTPNAFGTNARYDPAGEWIVVEGDESDHSFLDYPRAAALVTNVEADHLEHWNDDFEVLATGFEEFIDGARDVALVCADDKLLARWATSRSTVRSYGFAADADYRGINYRSTTSGAALEVAHRGKALGSVELRLRGRDMAQNAVGAAAFAHELGVSWRAITEALATFEGVARRFQFRSSFDGVDCFDDYAHTATEVAATLRRAREGPWNRVIAVFQPHRYTRIARHWAEFADAFVDADLVIVTPLDPAFEDPIPDVSSALVVNALRGAHTDADVVDLADFDELRDTPWRYGKRGDIVVTLGCGTITDAHDLWIDEARARERRP